MKLVFAALLALLMASGGPLGAATLGERHLVVVGKSRIVELEVPFSEIIVGDPGIADVVVMNPNRLYLLGRALGTTNVQFLDEDGRAVHVIDLVVGADIAEAKGALDAAFPDHPIRVHSVNGGIRLSGSLPDEEAIERALAIAQTFLRNDGGAQTFLRNDGGAENGEQVINTLTVSDPPQVFLSVRIIEVARSASSELTSSLSRLSVEATNSDVGQWSLGPLDFTLEALAQNGLARLLATPTLTAQSGQTASFLAGGEVAVPVPDGEGGTQIEFKEFGVRLTFTPKVIDASAIQLALEPEVSQIGLAGAEQGSESLTFTTRRANTTVTLASGESFAIAGLLQNNQARASARLPFLGDIPVIGALFRDSTLRDSTTDLLILVTPSLTQPTRDPASIPLPTDGRRAASGWDFFAEGNQEVSTYTLRDALGGRQINGFFGPMLSMGSQGAMTGSGRD